MLSQTARNRATCRLTGILDLGVNGSIRYQNVDIHSQQVDEARDYMVLMLAGREEAVQQDKSFFSSFFHSRAIGAQIARPYEEFEEEVSSHQTSSTQQTNRQRLGGGNFRQNDDPQAQTLRLLAQMETTAASMPAGVARNNVMAEIAAMRQQCYEQQQPDNGGNVQGNLGNRQVQRRRARGDDQQLGQPIGQQIGQQGGQQGSQPGLVTNRELKWANTTINMHARDRNSVTPDNYRIALDIIERAGQRFGQQRQLAGANS